MTILAFIDPEPHQEDVAADVAAALADYCMVTNTELALVSDSTTAIEVGLTAMQSSDRRTVEGSERRTSPIRILGVIERAEDLEGDSREDRFSGDQEPVEQLQEIGAFREAELRHGPAGEFASRVYDEAREAKTVIGIGRPSDLWSAASDGVQQRKGEVIGLPGLVPPDARVPVRTLKVPSSASRRGDEEEGIDPGIREITVVARRSGETVAALLEFLSGLSAR